MNVWRLSISVSMLIIWVFLIRFLGKKYLNKRVMVMLWDLVLLRALIPIRIPIEKIPFVNSRVEEIPLRGNILLSSISKETRQFSNQSYNTQIEQCLFALWLAGVLVTCFFMIRRSIKELYDLRNIEPVHSELAEVLIKEKGFRRRVGIYKGSHFSSPVTSGFFRPKIILPEEFERESKIHMKNMILHELEHIQSFDVQKRLCMSVAVCLHWFNPLVWICSWFYRQDQEMACDERVLRFANHKEAKEYAETLICMSARKEKEAVLFEGFQKRNAERERILAAIENRKMSVGGTIAAIVLAASSIVSFAYYAPKTDPGPVQSTQKATGKQKESGMEASDITTGQSRERWMAEIEHYRLIWEDVLQNHNDPDEPFTAEQEEAYDYYLKMELAQIHLKSLEEGKALNKENMELIEEIYPDRNYMKKN